MLTPKLSGILIASSLACLACEPANRISNRLFCSSTTNEANANSARMQKLEDLAKSARQQAERAMAALQETQAKLSALAQPPVPQGQASTVPAESAGAAERVVAQSASTQQPQGQQIAALEQKPSLPSERIQYLRRAAVGPVSVERLPALPNLLPAKPKAPERVQPAPKKNKNLGSKLERKPSAPARVAPSKTAEDASIHEREAEESDEFDFFDLEEGEAALAAESSPQGVASIPRPSQPIEAHSGSEKDRMEQRFRRALRLFESRDEEQRVKMTIIEPNGTRKVRELHVQRTGRTGEQRMLARVIRPLDLKGSSVLLVSTQQTDNQWVYLPSSKQTRKVVTSEQKGFILGSELRYEDFNPSAIRRSHIQLLRTDRIENKNYDVFEVRIPEGTSPYQRAHVWIDPTSEMPIQIDYYIKASRVKTIEFSNYHRVGAIWRPGTIAVRNLVTRRGTQIEISEVRINTGLQPAKLSVDALARVW